MGEKEHCGEHGKNMEDITTMKTRQALIMWMTPIIIALASSITGFIMKNTNDNISMVSASVQRIEGKIETMALTTERNNARLEYHERAERKP